jgi:transcription initiation factor IIF auxiliary subunit
MSSEHKKKHVQKRYSDVELQGPDERKTLNDKHSKQGSKHGTKQKNAAQNKRTRHKTKERGTKKDTAQCVLEYANTKGCCVSKMTCVLEVTCVIHLCVNCRAINQTK